MSSSTANGNTALVLSGGLALGAYHAGAYAALEAAGGPLPDHLAGCSIGAVTAAIIAGNPPGERVAQLRRFWDAVTDASPEVAPWAGLLVAGPWQQALSWASAARTGLLGRPGLFHPRLPMAGDPTPGLYDLAPLRGHLEQAVDFARLNGGEVRVSIAATDLVSGERVVFDTGRGDRIGPEHLLATSALAPLFAPVEVGGRLLGDGGLVANTPLDLVLDAPPAGPLLVIACDLFAREGSHPHSLGAAAARAGDLVFGNQTCRQLDAYRREHALRAVIANLTGRLPRGDGALGDALPTAREHGASTITVLHLAYRTAAEVGGPQKGFSYAASTLAEHWRAGEEDLRAALRVLGATAPAGFQVHAVRG